jgi:hypothetical protein
MKNTYIEKCREGVLMFASLVILIAVTFSIDLAASDGVPDDDRRFS